TPGLTAIQALEEIGHGVTGSINRGPIGGINNQRLDRLILQTDKGPAFAAVRALVNPGRPQIESIRIDGISCQTSDVVIPRTAIGKLPSGPAIGGLEEPMTGGSQNDIRIGGRNEKRPDIAAV